MGVLACVCVGGALAYATYFVCKDGTVPTYDEREARKQELREYVESIHVDYGLYKTRQRIYTERRQIEALREEIIEDIERIYDAAVLDGTFLYKCNNADVFVAIPRGYLAQNFGIHINETAYLIEYCRRLLPIRTRVDSQAGIPGIDARGHPILDRAVWDTAFRRSYVETDNLNLFISSTCAEIFKVEVDVEGVARIKTYPVTQLGRSADYDTYILPSIKDLPYSSGNPGGELDVRPALEPFSWLVIEVYPCSVSFVRYPLSADGTARWPQTLVDATHYLNPRGAITF